MANVKLWNKENLISGEKYRFFPTDMMMRALFSDSYFEFNNVKENGTILDIGTSSVNNLVPFYDRGWNLFGTEVTDEAVEIAKTACCKNGITAEVNLGFNRKLPFGDGVFDILLSIATIHYEESVKDVRDALHEFNRVLDGNGCALIQTPAPNHWMRKNSIKLGENLYQLKNTKDIRDQQLFTFFEKHEEFEILAKEFFGSIEVARCTELYPNKNLDFWLFKLGNPNK